MALSRILNHSFETLSLKKQDVWNRLLKLEEQKNEGKRAKIQELKDSVAHIGISIIDSLLNASKVTQEQAYAWASDQVIEKSA